MDPSDDCVVGQLAHRKKCCNTRPDPRDGVTPGTVIPRTTRLDASTRSTLCSIPAACAHRLDYSCPNIEATLYAP